MRFAKCVTTGVAALVLAGSSVATTAAHSAVPKPPNDATPVPVRSGHKVTGIDLPLPRSAQHSARLTVRFVLASTGKPAIGATAVIFDAAGHRVASNQFAIPNHRRDAARLTAYLPPSARGYAVCIKQYRGGYPAVAPTCVGSGPWVTKGKPADAKLVPLRPGQRKDLGTVRVPLGARIMGRAVDWDGRAMWGYVVARSGSYPDVVIFKLVGEQHGRFRFYGLPASPKGWAVCVPGWGFPERGAESRTGYQGTCGKSSPWNGIEQTGVPPLAVPPVHVKAGGTTRRVVRVLKKAGAVAGTAVSASSGKSVKVVRVDAYDHKNRLAAQIFQAGKRYQLPDLVPGRSYRICVTIPSTNYYGAESSYWGRCYGSGKNWDPGQRPVGRFVRVPHAKQVNGINFRLRRAASITGVVRNANGKPDGHARVYLYSASGKRLRAVNTMRVGRVGHYHLRRMVRNRSYYVCARDIGHPRATAPVRPAPACFGNAPWRGPRGPLPHGARRIRIAGVHPKSGVDIALPAGGEISGTMTDAATGKRLAGEVVELFTATGRLLQRRPTAGNDNVPSGATYVFSGVPASKTGYLVCAPGDRYRKHVHSGECWRRVAWNR